MPKSEPYVLVVRKCPNNMQTRNQFVWPKSGLVKCPDWIPNNKCGNGLHGYAWGIGLHDADESMPYSTRCANNGKWVVIKVAKKNLISLKLKCKFKCGEVIYCGNKKTAFATLLRDKNNPKYKIWSIDDMLDTTKRALIK